MQYLGICDETGAVYEGNSTSNGYRIERIPSLSATRFSDDPTATEVLKYFDRYPTALFREDSFDPTTKLRRDRVFSGQGPSQTTNWHVFDPTRTDYKQYRKIGNENEKSLRIFTYQKNSLTNIRNLKSNRSYPKVILGEEPFSTSCKIVNIESDYTGTPVISLKALYSLGELPDLIVENIPQEDLKPLASSLDRLEECIHKAGPIDIIDRCRDTLSIVFGSICGNKSKDLSNAIKEYLTAKSNGKDDLNSWAGRIVARLHSRGKPNEQIDKNLKPPTDEDAQLAFKCVYHVLTSFNWAK